MGLPLYRAPVESDIKPKVHKDPPTRARSTIRRTVRRADLNSTPSGRFYARRHGRASPGAEAPSWGPWDNRDAGPVDTENMRAGAPPPAGLRRATTLNDTMAGPSDAAIRQARAADPASRTESSSRYGVHQDMARYFGEHMAMLHAATSSRSRPRTETPSEGDETEPTAAYGRAPQTHDRRPDNRRMAPSPYSWSVPRDAPASARPRASSSQPSTRAGTRLGDVLFRQDGHLVAMRRMHAVRAAHAARTPSAAGEASPPRSQAQSPVDGLGDRDRSLSPETEGVWDTLLSSITPDPQPPSVGASFASTSAPASGSTSQNTDASAQSSRTNTSAPTTIDALEFDFEHPCESGGDNSDTEGEDDDLEQLTLRRFRRTYADVTRPRDEDDLEIMGGVESMQRIVRNLARREDIPDEWWADAGLSRSLQTRREAA